MAIPEVNYIFYVNLWQIIINGGAFFIFTIFAQDQNKQKDIRQITPNKIQAVLTITIYAVVSGIGLLLLLISAKTVSAVVLYPFVTGGTIVLSVVTARIFFKEKISVPALAGVILAFGGTLLFLI
jgi:drug/metabolite transporter (DMT)-like permease